MHDLFSPSKAERSFCGEFFQGDVVENSADPVLEHGY